MDYDDFEEYVDDDPNVIGMATHDDKTIVFISAPGDALGWERMTLFPTLDSKRVIVATPMEPLIGMGGLGPDTVKKYLNTFLSDAILLANEHFESIEGERS